MSYGKTELVKTYEAGVKRWKDSKPKLKMSGRRVSSLDREKHNKALKDWKAKKPPSFSEFKAMNQPAQGPSVAPKKTSKPSGKVGQGTVLKNTSPKQQKKTVKQFDKIMKNAKGGKSGFGRKLLSKLKFSGSGKRTAMRGKIR